MLPKQMETPRLKELREKSEAAPAEAFVTWPRPTKDDFMLIGIVVVLYSYIDLNLRRIIDAAEAAGVWKPAKGKAATLRIGEVEDGVLALRKWEPQNEYALRLIKEMRGLRNLCAHFAVRRFPEDDAFIFLTRSARDYKQVTGTEPEIGELMTAIIEVQAVKDAIKHIDGLQQWLSTWAPVFEAKFKAGEAS
jgi:hypothetical protein